MNDKKNNKGTWFIPLLLFLLWTAAMWLSYDVGGLRDAVESLSETLTNLPRQ